MFQLFNRSSNKTRIAFLLLVGLVIASCSSAEQRAQSYYEHGAKLLAQHDNQKAAIEFKNAIRLKKDMLPAWRGLAQIDESVHHWAELVPVLKTIVELDPKDVETKLKLARIMLYGGATDEALKLVNSIEDADNAN